MYNVDVKGAIERLISYFSKGSVEVRGDGLVNISVSESNIGSLEEVGYLLEVEVVRDFSCRYCKNLRDLSGSPKEVYGNFNCSICDNLKSLEGSPRYVGGYFYCGHCNSLINLLGSPRVVGGDFDCCGCKGLISLEGCPREVYGDFDCSWCDKLREIKFDVREIRKNLRCVDCKSLEYIDEGVISKVGKKVCIKGCKNIRNMNEIERRFGDKIDWETFYI